MKQAGEFMIPESDSYFAPFLEAGGFQIDHLEEALKFVTEFNVAIDGGAHVGSWSRRLSEVFEEVIAFEPAEDTFECLKVNTELDQSIAIHKAALGASSGRGRIVDDISRFGNTGSRFMNIDDEGPIEIISLDSLGLDELDFLKLDVEGFEYYALLGGEKTIRGYRPTILVEEKGFGRRYDLQPLAASNLLVSWGAVHVAKIGNDHVFVF